MLLVDKISEIASCFVAGMGYELYAAELSNEHAKPVIRIYVDKKTGVNIDDCHLIGKKLLPILNVEANIGDLNVEVSSPGIDRKLFKIEHYQTQIGSVLQLKLKENISLAADDVKRQKLKATLTKIEGNDLHFKLEDCDLTINFKDILQGRVVPQW